MAIEIHEANKTLYVPIDSVPNFIKMIRYTVDNVTVLSEVKNSFNRSPLLSIPGDLIAYLAMTLDSESAFNLYYTLFTTIKKQNSKLMSDILEANDI